MDRALATSSAFTRCAAPFRHAFASFAVTAFLSELHSLSEAQHNGADLATIVGAAGGGQSGRDLQACAAAPPSDFVAHIATHLSHGLGNVVIADLSNTAVAYLQSNHMAGIGRGGGGVVEELEVDVAVGGMDVRQVPDVEPGMARSSRIRSKGKRTRRLQYGTTINASDDESGSFFSALLGNPFGLSQADAPWSLDRIDQRSLPLNGGFHDGPSEGKGVDMYILDSGIRASHTEFRGRVAPGANFSPDQGSTDVSDCNGHGTHVASLAAGSTFGAARQATIIPVRVYDCSNAGPLSQALSGIDWTLQRIKKGGRMLQGEEVNAAGSLDGHGRRLANGKRAVINMSWGGPPSAVLNNAVGRLADAGAVVVVAAGNENQNACNLSPANAREAFTVAASNPDDSFAPYSNFGSCVDVVAPGTQVPGAGTSSDTAVRTLTGTSMASPVTAGVAGVYLSKNGNADPKQVRDGIRCSSTPSAVRDSPAGTTANLLYSPPDGFPGTGQCAAGGSGAAATAMSAAVAIVAAMPLLLLLGAVNV